MNDTDQENLDEHKLAGCREGVSEESFVSGVEARSEDHSQDRYVRAYERQALREIAPMVKCLQMSELPMFTTSELLQACSQVIEQICSLAIQEGTGADASACEEGVEAVFMKRFAAGRECFVKDDALSMYLQWLTREKIGFVCEPLAEGEWVLMKVDTPPER